MAKEELVYGVKSNGIVKTDVGKYKFTYRKKLKRKKDFSRSKTLISNKGKKVVLSEYNKWVKSLSEEEESHFLKSSYGEDLKDIKLSEYIKVNGEWEEWAKNNYSIGSLRNVMDAMIIIRENKQFCDEYISKISKQDCEKFFEDLLIERPTLKENSLKKIKQALSSTFRRRKTDNNPTLGIELPKTTEDRVSKKEAILRKDNINIVLKKVKETKDKRFIAVVYTTLFLCLRRGEVHAMEVSDIEFNNNLVSISKTMVQLGNQQIIQEGTKNGESRKVPLFKEVKIVINDYIKYREEKGYKKYVDEDGIEHNYIFSNKNGKLPHLETFSQRFKKIIDELIEDEQLIVDRAPSFHSLRGTGISYYALDKKIQVQFLKTMAGHKDVKTTLEYYIKPQDEDMMELAKEPLDSSFFDILKED